MNSENQEASRAYFIPYQNEELAVPYERDNSSFFQTHNGQWKLKDAEGWLLNPDHTVSGVGLKNVMTRPAYRVFPGKYHCSIIIKPSDK